jgi:hypothetical protein
LQPRSVLLITKTVKKAIVHTVLLSIFNGLGAGCVYYYSHSAHEL